jgi:3D (Asp-Asp-Asp) domain-containing protein
MGIIILVISNPERGFLLRQMSTLFLGTIMAVSAILFSGQSAAGIELSDQKIAQEHPYLIPGDDSLLAQNEFSSRRSVATVTITAYSSTEDQTDDTPFVTAWNTQTRIGVVAANWLPLGTKVRIPELFGNQVFTVEDRMHPRNAHKLDIWFQSREEALKFGVKKARVEIL